MGSSVRVDEGCTISILWDEHPSSCPEIEVLLNRDITHTTPAIKLVAVLGLGNVGSEVVRIIEDSADDLAARIGAPLVLRGVGVRKVSSDRGVPVERLLNRGSGSPRPQDQ